MPRRVGHDWMYDFEEVPKEELVHSPDGTRAAYFWTARRTEDRFDDDVTYSVAEWATDSGELLELHTCGHEISHLTGQSRGSALASLHYDEKGSLQLEFSDGSSRPAIRKFVTGATEEQLARWAKIKHARIDPEKLKRFLEEKGNDD